MGYIPGVMTFLFFWWVLMFGEPILYEYQYPSKEYQPLVSHFGVAPLLLTRR